MIRYTLTCHQAHSFDSWFQSSQGFDALAAGGHLSCAVCGSAQVTRALMAPAVATKGEKPLAQPASEAEKQLSAMRDHLEANSDYVGLQFATEARRMHAGDAPARAIWGEAKLEDARRLIEDGVPVAPLPFLPKRKSH